MLAEHRVQRLGRAFDLGERGPRFRRGAPPDRLGALAERRFSGDRLGDRLRPAHRLLAELGGAKIVRASARRLGQPAVFQNLREAGRVIERVQRAGHAAPLRLRLRRLL